MESTKKPRPNRHIADKLYREKNKVKINKRRKKWYKANTDKVKESNKKWHKENPEKRKDQTKRYREKNRLKLAEKHSIWYEANKGKISEKYKDLKTFNEREQMEYVCKCENCDKYLIDTDPLVNAIQFNVNKLNLDTIIESGCPNCKTDSFLIDVRKDPKILIKLFV